MSSIQILGCKQRVSLFVALCAVFPACSSDQAEPGDDAGNAGTGGVAGNGGTTSEAGTSGTAGDGAGEAGALGEGGSSGAAGGGAEGGSSGAGGTTDGGAAGDDASGGASGGQGGAPSVRSSGCSKDVTEPFDNWTTHDITVTVDPEFVGDGYGDRRYFTRPPVNYDPNVAYPVTIWGQGCGQNVAETTPMTLGPAADNSIQVQLLAKHSCYSAGPDGDNANSPELPYFDLVLAQVEDAFCIDKSKVFVGGYSSGGWLSGLISCNRTDVVRGVGWAAAGLQLNHAECTGPVAAIITRGTGDGGTPLDQTLAARDSILMRNGCSMDTLPWNPAGADFDNSSCLEYQGCMPGYPVVWCPTPGQHSNGLDTGLSSKGFWALWSSLP